MSKSFHLFLEVVGFPMKIVEISILLLRLFFKILHCETLLIEFTSEFVNCRSLRCKLFILSFDLFVLLQTPVFKFPNELQFVRILVFEEVYNDCQYIA